MTEARGTPEPGAAAAVQGGAVADAPRGNWVDRFAPPGWRPYLRLSRADRPIGTWLLYLPCLWGLALSAAAGGGFGAFDLWIAAGCGIGAFLMRGAGCTWNDLSDRDFDAAVARTRSRPLPSGQVTPRQAAVWMAAQAAVAALVLFTFPWPAVALGVASLALVAVYPFAKRFTWWPQVFLGLAFNWGVPVAWAAQTGAFPPPAAWVLWGAGIAWTLFYDTIYAHQDKDDDALIGVKSTARLFGDAGTRPWLRGFLAATVAAMAGAAALALVPAGAPLGVLLVALAAPWALGAHLAWQLARLDTADPARCLHLFRSNRDAGVIAALFLAGAAGLAGIA